MLTFGDAGRPCFGLWPRNCLSSGIETGTVGKVSQNPFRPVSVRKRHSPLPLVFSVTWNRLSTSESMTLERILRWAVAIVIQPVSLVTLLSNLPPPESSHSRTFAAKVLVKAIGEAIDKYKSDVSEYPPRSVGLRALTHDFGVHNWRGPYFSSDRRLDSWGHPYVYRYNGTSKPEVVSYGADGQPSGSGINADLSSSDPTATRNWGIWARILRLTLLAVSAMGFFGYPFMPALLAKLNARLAHRHRKQHSFP
jgi:general secretion pathway protein G